MSDEISLKDDIKESTMKSESVFQPELIMGICGPINSGCTTTAKVLESQGFNLISLSSFVKTEWAKKNPGTTPNRGNLQDTGNELRKVNGNGHFAIAAINKAESTKTNLVVIDGIRNLGEVQSFRIRFRNFFLISVIADDEIRRRRAKEKAGNQGIKFSDEEYTLSDERDKNEDRPQGQQVAECVNDSDIVIINNDQKMSSDYAKSTLGKKIKGYIDLLLGKRHREPSTHEIYMNMAYAASFSSKCLKRWVGAVIVKEEKTDTEKSGKPETYIRGSVLGVGYNENPEFTLPCIHQYGHCYKDDAINARLKQIKICPYCGAKLEGANIEKSKCTDSGCSKDIKPFFFPDRGMNHCTAVHAEERAMVNASNISLMDATMYSTTFPCFSCARQIIARGIKRIHFVEPYEIEHSKGFLRQSGVEVIRFEGVKSRAFYRVFGDARKRLENEYK